MVSIISNTAAAVAQSNLKKANSDAAASIARLSSGNKIDRAATDVAALSIGTLMKAAVSTLASARTNAAQASSLLGVADGALGMVGDLLQRQKALATQATSGTLSASDRGFLNLEFQQLITQIDSIAGNTNFNGVNLLDGSLYTPAKLTTKSAANSVSTVGTITFNAVNTAAADKITINGVQFDFKAALDGAPTTIVAGTQAAPLATSLYNAIKNVQMNTDSTGTNQDNRNKLAMLDFSVNGATITITTKSSGTVNNGTGVTVIGNFAGAALGNCNGTVFATGAATTVNLSAGGTAGTDGDLAAGTFAGSVGGTVTAYAGTATTITQGTVADNILTAIAASTTTAAGPGWATGVATNGVSNNAAFVGKVSGFKATYVANNFLNLNIQVGDYEYTCANVASSGFAGDHTSLYRFSSIQDGGGFFDLQFNTAATSGLTTAITDQAGADIIAQRLNMAFAGLDFFQNRKVASYTAAGTIFPTGSTTSSGNLAGTSVNFISNNFDNVNVESVSVQAPVAGGANATISFVINGDTYISGFDGTGATLSSGLGTSLANNSTLGFVSTTDPRKILTFTNKSGAAISFDTAAKAQGFQAALENAFGIGTGGAGLSFQTGTTSDDSISVQIKSAHTASLYTDNSGNAVTGINIGGADATNAQTAGSTLDNAIATLTAIRATVGAYQSRFDFAASNIDTSAANLDTARGVFLDTDVEQESTKLATAQVRLQASISVLAQANQMPQNLLKLIG